MTLLNIIDLIENNPITKLSDSYNNKLLIKIKEKFNELHQQFFISSFYCYLNYNQNTDFIINLDNIWKWIGFSNKAQSKILLYKNFTLNIDYKLEKKKTEKKKGRGGSNKEYILITIKTFKLLCIKAETKKSKEIYEYYLDLEEILYEIIREEHTDLKIQFENQKILKHELINQNILLDKYKNYNGELIFIIKLKSFKNGSYIIKIEESSNNFIDVFNKYNTKYNNILLLDCITVNNSKNIRQTLYNNEVLKQNKVTDLEYLKDFPYETELFLIRENFSLNYQILLNIINMIYFDELEKEKFKLKADLNKDQIIFYNFMQEYINSNKLLLNKVDNLEKLIKEMSEKLNSMETKTTTNYDEPLITIGPRLQKINPETLQLVKVYETVTECMKENTKIKRPSLNKAVIENTIYNGFRWILVDRELDANIIYNIEPTKQTKIQNLGYIAKLNITKTEILNIYLDRKTACQYNDYKSLSSLDIPVKQFTITKNNYYLLFDNCDDKLKNDFIAKHKEPILYKNGIGQFDINNNLIKEFVCKYDCIRTMKMSDRTLAKALNKKIIYNNYYYKYIGSKLKML